MSALVVDASVGVKWFVPEVHAAEARAWRTGPDELHVTAFFFDLACPFSYLTAERVERTLGDVDWVPCSLPRERGEPTPDVIARAERQALALSLPLVWPEVFPSGVPAALRAAAYASEMGAGPRFALAASRRKWVRSPFTARP